MNLGCNIKRWEFCSFVGFFDDTLGYIWLNNSNSKAFLYAALLSDLLNMHCFIFLLFPSLCSVLLWF